MNWDRSPLTTHVSRLIPDQLAVGNRQLAIYFYNAQTLLKNRSNILCGYFGKQSTIC